jgi:OFA family oxalate/formate antiporter-like MFS transporter
VIARFCGNHQDVTIEARNWGRAAIQMAFTIFVVTETWLVPVEAWFVDRFGPQVVVMFGGVMIALSWVLNSYADSLVWLYTAAMVGGIGAGSIYGTCVGNALKWFPDRRGLAAGATAAGFGAGAAITVVPIAHMVAASGYQTAFLDFGIGQGLIVFVLAFFLRKPSQVMPARKKQLNLPQTRIDFTPSEVLRTPIFWMLYLVFVMVAAAQIGPIAHDFKIADTSVSLLGFQMAALTFAISLDRIFDGFGRPFFGWVSDTIGREYTMFIAFGTAALMVLVLSIYGHNPIVFVLATAIYFGVFGEIYSLFPATSGDTFRRQICDDEQRHAVHRQGNGLPAGAARQHSGLPLWLAGRLRHRARPERHRGAAGTLHHP